MIVFAGTGKSGLQFHYAYGVAGGLKCFRFADSHLEKENFTVILDVRDLNDSKLYERVGNVLGSVSAIKRVFVCINAEEDPQKMKSFMEKSGFNVTISNRKDGYLLRPL